MLPLIMVVMIVDFFIYIKCILTFTYIYLSKFINLNNRQHIYIHNITIPVKYNLAGQNTKI